MDFLKDVNRCETTKSAFDVPNYGELGRAAASRTFPFPYLRVPSRTFRLQTHLALCRKRELSHCDNPCQREPPADSLVALRPD